MPLVERRFVQERDDALVEAVPVHDTGVAVSGLWARSAILAVHLQGRGSQNRTLAPVSSASDLDVERAPTISTSRAPM